jgi:predicted P-loop ATPase
MEKEQFNSKHSTEERQPFLKGIMDSLKMHMHKQYEIRYDIIEEVYKFRPRGTKEEFAEIDERTQNDMVMSAINAGINCIDRDVTRVIRSSESQEFNPMKDYLDKLPRWDGKDRVKELALRISDDKLWVTVFHRWMLALVAQWMQLSGTYGNNMSPILIHPVHGTRKSSFCRVLLPPCLTKFFFEDFNISKTMEASKAMAKFGLINLDEIRKYSPTHMERLKNLIQLPKVKLPRLYHGGYRYLNRLASFIGTSNYRDVLTDPTGSRRFFPVELKGRIVKLHICYKQLYAQLKTELRQGKRYWFTPHEETLITRRNTAFYRRPLEEALFFKLFRLPKDGEQAKRFTISELYERMRNTGKATMKDITLTSFAKHLALIGAKTKHSRLGNYYEVVEV